jgi:hypothetical protein
MAVYRDKSYQTKSHAGFEAANLALWVLAAATGYVVYRSIKLNRARKAVMIKGNFAGAPRPLYHVGAPPPNRDYSFTRRPGFNAKDY